MGLTGTATIYGHTPGATPPRFFRGWAALGGTNRPPGVLPAVPAFAAWRAHPMFSCPSPDLYVCHARRCKGGCEIVLAKPGFVVYTADRLIGLSSKWLSRRRQGALPLRQAHDTLRPADGWKTERPPHSRASYTALQTGFGVLGGSA